MTFPQGANIEGEIMIEIGTHILYYTHRHTEMRQSLTIPRNPDMPKILYFYRFHTSHITASDPSVSPYFFFTI